MKGLWLVSLILVIIGGLNWGLIGIANVNLIDRFLSIYSINRIIYALVGLAAVYLLVSCKKCKSCMKK